MEDDKPKVIVVDDSRTSRTYCKVVLSGSYDVTAVASGDEFFALLETRRPDVVLLDVEMPGMSGYDVLQRFTKDPRNRAIPVLFLTGRDEFESELAGLQLGAVDYIPKNAPPQLLLRRIEIQFIMARQRAQLKQYNDNLQRMVQEKTRAIIELQNAVFDLLTQVVEYRDGTTGGHVDRTTACFNIMLEALQRYGIYGSTMRGWDPRLVVLSSQLHDIGKVAIPDSVLLKPGRLTADEFERMKKHTVYGAQIIERIERNITDRSFIDHARNMAEFHHERWDGSGYPNGLRGEAIPLEGRIMSIVDVYDALVSSRPYKEPIPHEKAVDIIMDGAGTHFDPRLVQAFAGVSPYMEVATEYAMAGD